MSAHHRNSAISSFARFVAVAIAMLGLLGVCLYLLGGAGRAKSHSADGGAGNAPALRIYCAAGLRAPVEAVVAAYEREFDTVVQLQYGGSNTLLSQIEMAQTGDLFLAADESYLQQGRQRGLVREVLPLATMQPVILVAAGNPKQITRIEDLLRDDVRTALGNPDQAAIGKTTKKLLTASRHWAALEAHVTQTGVFKPTVPEVANDVKLGSVDAGIVWDVTANLYSSLTAIRLPELDKGVSSVSIGILSTSGQPTQALHFARYLAARDKGLSIFRDQGFQTVQGDRWETQPQLTFFCGSVNRRAVESIVLAFEQREGVRVNTIYNGCGILTAQMLSIRDQQQANGFPDTYMACDRYYLETVKDWFQDDVDVSDTEVVIVVPRGNPARISGLLDLTKPGVRISVGQPDQCTIGVLTRQVLQQEKIYDQVMANVVTQTATSSMLIPTVTTNAVDATLAYATDTLAESDKVEAIRIVSPAAQAIQPFAVARTSEHKFLAGRFYQAIAAARQQFEQAGFHFRLEGAVAAPAATVQP